MEYLAVFTTSHQQNKFAELYHRFITNDASTVHYFANDKATRSRNKAELAGKSERHLRIQEQWQVSIKTGQNVTVSIRLSHSFQISVLSILKRQLFLSTAEIKKLIDEGHISGITMKELKSRKLMTGYLDFQLSAVTLYARRKVVMTQR